MNWDNFKAFSFIFLVILVLVGLIAFGVITKIAGYKDCKERLGLRTMSCIGLVFK